MPPSVYISYRRQDTRDVVGRLYDRLAGDLSGSQIFVDVDVISAGADFVQAIRSAIADSTVVLAVIGPDWLRVDDHAGAPLIHREDDFVRAEIATALHLKLPVIPVLVDGARMPSANELPADIADLSRRQALILRRESFSQDAARLADAIGRLSAEEPLPLAARSRLTTVGENLRAVAIEFFSASGRRVSDTVDRRLLGPEPILILDASSLGDADLADIKAMARSTTRLHLVHPDQLSDASTSLLDQLRAHGTAVIPLSGHAMAAALADGRARSLLLELEREYGSERNLFETKNSVIDERFLFGRAELLTRLGSSIAAAESVLLTGLRKAGKTSVLNILRQHLVDYPVCRLDLQRFDRAAAWEPALHRLMIEAYDRWGRSTFQSWPFRAPAEADFFDEMERRREFQAEQPRSMTPFVVILDELERVLPLPGGVAAAAHYTRATGSIRGLAQSYPGWIAVIAADLRPTANRVNLLPGGETNPFFQFFDEVPLRLIDAGAVDAMIRSLGTAMGVRDVDRRLTHAIFRLSGGHPALVRILAGASHRTRRDPQRLELGDLRSGLESLAETNLLGSFFGENFWGPMTETEQRVIVQATGSRRWLRRLAPRAQDSDAEAEARSSLTGQGLLRGDSVAVAAFADWLRARHG